MQKVSNNFYDVEFLPKAVYLGQTGSFTSPAWGTQGMRFIDKKIITVVEKIRELSGKKVIINNWAFGGTEDGRCLRLPDDPAYTWHSCHSFGRAADINIDGMSAPDVWNFIMAHAADLIPLGLTGLEAKEDTPTWTHITVSDFDFAENKKINGLVILPTAVQKI